MECRNQSCKVLLLYFLINIVTNNCVVLCKPVMPQNHVLQSYAFADFCRNNIKFLVLLKKNPGCLPDN